MLAQNFGIAELGQMTREGAIRSCYWTNSDWPSLKKWAHARGITDSDDLIT